MPFVLTVPVIDIGFPFDPVGEWPACLACFIRALYDDDRVCAVVFHANEFFPLSCFDRIGEWRMVPKELLRVMDDLPELTVTAAFECSRNFLGDIFGRVDFGWSHEL
ncbi:hypothetical protein HacjB3_19438 (plasmid) [Halalkalicoccus jeotgali B3]|uniref:Uncharacterized protein n=1 Tax=Halalkalicoccus jeotgali (strain DSM 18796 / CECT 7217 / JCM 14584 / KCTC 4019 / B3) TaxID=795797 RepID=D8JCT5_HALJB|nr:hypothetical protein HacjB3_17438 [Halalkalicoccus jeotgali B3]ADJ17224.1 hypothetical protein HacjB3_19438 [Halalkalicoccus jeotgali B3]